MYKKVMVIDDNEIDLYISKRVMTKKKFAEEIILIDSAKEALEYLNLNANIPDNLPDLIFLDINMPEMNGFEFLDAYTHLSDDIKQKCIIMMLTTSVHPEDKERVDNNPYVSRYLNKPITDERLDSLE